MYERQWACLHSPVLLGNDCYIDSLSGLGQRRVLLLEAAGLGVGCWTFCSVVKGSYKLKIHRIEVTEGDHNFTLEPVEVLPLQEAENPFGFCEHLCS